jgi:predicted DNA-binding transcriptional regulator YafY
MALPARGVHARKVDHAGCGRCCPYGTKPVNTPAPDLEDAEGPAHAGAGNPKLQRWVDLIAALLARSLPTTFEDLARSVPEYKLRVEAYERETDDGRRRTLQESLKRTFERDKDELRSFGVPIASLPDEDGNTGGAYRLLRKDFYLPYLCFAVPGGGMVQPPKVDRWGYQALTSLTFEADELQAVVDAAACVRALGDPLLAADIESALRKLAVDLPLGAAAASADEPSVVLPRARPDFATFEALSDALTRRKVATFTYHAMSTDRTEQREVEPYGLFFLHGHWYLAGRDRARAELRNFRLNRVSGVKVNTRRPQTADYAVPEDFRLRDHARSRQAWELGDGDAIPAIVRFDGASGPTVAAMRLGQPVQGRAEHRSFEVRRIDPFVRWLLSFAGELRPVSPPDIVTRYAQEAATTAGVYAAGVEPAARRRSPVAAPSPAQSPWQPRGAAAQLRRILHVVPEIADGEEHSLSMVAERIGTTVDTLRRDLYSLVTRFDTPAGFVEGVQLYVEPDRVSAVSNHLARPMRLTVSELCALELGLAVLHARRPPDEHPLLERARARLRSVIAQLPGDPIPDGLYGAALGEQGSTAHLAAVRTALRERRKLRLVYRKSGSATPGERIVCPYALAASSGALYVVARCDEGESIRVFRMDRVEDAEATEQRFDMPADFSLDAVLREGRVFYNEQPGTMLVRYSPRVARWIAEREGRVPDDDGALVIEHPLADWEWGMRHVLQYGPEAEVLEPAALRERLRERLAAMASQAGAANAASTSAE